MADAANRSTGTLKASVHPAAGGYIPTGPSAASSASAAAVGWRWSRQAAPMRLPWCIIAQQLGSPPVGRGGRSRLSGALAHTRAAAQECNPRTHENHMLLRGRSSVCQVADRSWLPKLLIPSWPTGGGPTTRQPRSRSSSSAATAHKTQHSNGLLKWISSMQSPTDGGCAMVCVCVCVLLRWCVCFCDGVCVCVCVFFFCVCDLFSRIFFVFFLFFLCFFCVCVCV